MGKGESRSKEMGRDASGDYKIEASVFDVWVLLEVLVPIVLYSIRGCIVEIGMGESTKILTKYAEMFGVKYYGCDTNKWKCNSITDYQRAEIHNCRSFDFMKQFCDRPAIVFLDGVHRQKVVSVEADFFAEKLLEGGMLFLHDTYTATKWIKRRFDKKGKKFDLSKIYYDMHKVRQALENREDFGCITFPYTAAECGMTLALKKQKYRMFYHA
jgi:hypothetical protein